MTPAALHDATARPVPAAFHSPSPSPVQLVSVVHREVLSSVFPSQVLTPLALHDKNVRVHLVGFVMVGQIMRPELRRRLQHLRHRAVEELGLSFSVLASPPSRFPKLWDDAATLRRWLRRRFAADERFVIRCRGAQATQLALRARSRHPQSRVVFDCRGSEPDELLYKTGQDLARPESWSSEMCAAHEACLSREAHAVRGADHILCVSGALRDRLLERYGADCGMITVVPCCPDVDLFGSFLSQRDGIRSELGLSRKFVVAYCGSLERYQLPDESLRMYRIIRGLEPNAHFLAVTTHVERMIAAVNRAGIAEADCTIRTCPPSEVPRYLASADVGLLLRDRSMVNQVASPVKFGEYMAAGLPAIISEGLGDYSAAVASHRLGVVVDWQASDESLCRQVSPFISDTAGREEMRVRCRRFAAGELSWAGHIPRVAEMLRQLTAKGS